MNNNSDNATPSPNSVLQERARVLAQPMVQEISSQLTLELLEFRLANEHYAIEAQFVDEVYPFKDLTLLPCTPPFILGIVNVRGRIVPVLEIKRFFDLPEKGITDLHRIILVRGNGLELSLMADAIEGLRTVAMDRLQSSMPTLTGIRSEYLKGITKEGLVVLDIARILSDPKIIVHEEVET